MDGTAKECGVCHEEFDEESRCPRIFNCFHILCTTCIDKLITNKTKHCPFCRRNFKASDANDVMISHAVLELMKYISLQELKLKASKKDPCSPRERKIEDLKKEAKETSCHHHVNCQEAEKHIEKTIKEVSNLQKIIIEENTWIKNEVMPKIHNVISRNNKTVEELGNTNRTLHTQLKEIKENNNKLEDIKGKLDSCNTITFKDTGVLLDEVEETNTAIVEWIDNFQELISEEEKNLQTTEKNIERTKEQINLILEVLSSREESDEEIDPIPGMAAMAIQEELLPGQITPEALRRLSAPVKHLVEQGRIFAVQEHKGRRRWARISIRFDDKLCLHHLGKEPLPPNVHILEFDDVMRLVDPSSRLTFLELAVIDGATLGRFYVRLYEDSEGVKKFAFLCTGEMGPCYADTNVFKVVNKGHNKIECVQWGDYQFDNRDKGDGVMPRLLDKESGRLQYWRSWVAGSVTGEVGSDGQGRGKASQFLIYTRDYYRDYCRTSVGIVEDGNEVLNEAIAHYPNIRNVFIRDCGIVL